MTTAADPVTARAGVTPLSLVLARGAIDGVDAALVALLAGRGRLACVAARSKRRAGLAAHDAARESRIHARAQRMAARLGVRADAARSLLGVAIEESRAQQEATRGSGHHWLRLLPQPSRIAPIARRIPDAWQRRALETAMARVLGASLEAGDLDFLQGRRLGIDVTDLDLHWVVGVRGVRDGRLLHVGGEPEASVRGSATDLLLMASRLEDADTLFFQRRLVLTGDTELGLTARNLLEGLRWDAVPLGLRIALDRGARLARAARAAHAKGRD
jgi:predicted lipid carrier protein YhbT/chorismate mutase